MCTFLVIVSSGFSVFDFWRKFCNKYIERHCADSKGITKYGSFVVLYEKSEPQKFAFKLLKSNQRN